MLCMKIILILMLISRCISDPPYLLRSYPVESTVDGSQNSDGLCSKTSETLSSIKSTDESTLNHSECTHNSDESLLICKLGLAGGATLTDLDTYPLDSINVLILYVQEFPSKKLIPRVLDLCFISRFTKPLQELAICGYRPSFVGQQTSSYLHLLDVPALAIVASKVQTLLINGVDLWQSVELRQFRSLKHLLIIQGRTLQMRYYHSPHCADCIGAHPQFEYSFHYLIPLQKQLTYFLYDSYYAYKECKYDLLKKIRSQGKISTFIVYSADFKNDLESPICDKCVSGLCPLLSVCLDEKTDDRRDKDKAFECLCVENIKVEDEFKLCKPMTLHQPMYSTRCNHTPSIWNYVTLSMIIAGGYFSSSIIVFILSTIFLIRSDQ